MARRAAGGRPAGDGRAAAPRRRGRRPPRETSGAYVGHLDGLPAGFIRNFKSGEIVRWKARGSTRALSPEEFAGAQAEAARRQLERERERRAEEEAAAKRMRGLWQRSRLAAQHPYLDRKDIAGHGLRVDQAGRLLVPMHDADGRIWSVQTITPAGEKLYERGCRTQGMHALLGDLTPGVPLMIAAGFATGATLRELTGLPVAVAFDSGNLLAVAEIYRRRDAERPILVAGDNDHHLPRRAAVAECGTGEGRGGRTRRAGYHLYPGVCAECGRDRLESSRRVAWSRGDPGRVTAQLDATASGPGHCPQKPTPAAVQPVAEPARQAARRRASEDQVPRVVGEARALTCVSGKASVRRRGLVRPSPRVSGTRPGRKPRHPDCVPHRSTARNWPHDNRFEPARAAPRPRLQP